MSGLLQLIVVSVVVTLLWGLIKIAKWAAPLSGVLGLFAGGVAATVGSTTGMLWGFGLFAFSSGLFVLGGGFEGR